MDFFQNDEQRQAADTRDFRKPGQSWMPDVGSARRAYATRYDPQLREAESFEDPSKVNEEDYRKMYQSGIQGRTDEAIRNAAMRRGMGRSGYAQAAVNRARDQGTEAMGQASMRAMLDTASERARRRGLGQQIRTDIDNRMQEEAHLAEAARQRADQEFKDKNRWTTADYLLPGISRGYKYATGDVDEFF